MWGIVEKVIEDKIFVIFEDRSRKSYINHKKLVIKENNQVLIVDNNIIEVKGYNEDLYKKIVKIQEKINNI